MRVNDTPSEAAAHKAVAAAVRAEMNRQGVTQNDLAELLGVAQQTISRRMTGVIPFDVAELAKIAEVLGVAASSFLAESERVA